MKHKLLAALCGLLLLPATLGAQEAKREALLNAAYEKLLTRPGVRADSVRYTGSDFSKAGDGFIWQRANGDGWTVGRRLTLRGVTQAEADSLYATFARVGGEQYVFLNLKNQAATYMKGTKTVFVYEYTPHNRTLYFLKATAEDEVSVPYSWKTADMVDATDHRLLARTPLSDLSSEQLWWLGGLVAVLLLTWAGWLAASRRRSLRHRRELERLAEKIDGLQRDFAEKREQIAWLNCTNEEKARHIARLRTELRCTEENLAQQKAELARLERGGLTATNAAADADTPDEAAVITYLRSAAREGKSAVSRDDLWNVLAFHASEQAPRLAQTLRQACLSEKDVRICLLVWARFNPSEIATLLASSKQNISTARARLFGKLFGEKGSARAFDERLQALGNLQPDAPAPKADEAEH